MVNLQKFWPIQEEIEIVCNQEAEFLPNHILLAIHQSLNFEHIPEKSNTASNVDEQFLLNDFTKETKENFKLSIIRGTSGVGKSHYIKWLQAKINSNEKYHIVWLRRNINLKEIFERILTPFKEDEIFGEILKEIETEFSTIESQPAVRFSSGLETVLRDEIKTLSGELEEAQKIYSNASVPQSERTKAHEKILSKKPILGHYKNLVMLIKEPTIYERFFEKTIFPRIIDRSLGGK